MNGGNSQALKGSCSFILPLAHGKIVAFTLFCTWIQSHRIWEGHQAQICPVFGLAAQKHCCTSNPSFSDVRKASIPVQGRFFNLPHLQLGGNPQEHSASSRVLQAVSPWGDIHRHQPALRTGIPENWDEETLRASGDGRATGQKVQKTQKIQKNVKDFW